MALDSSLDPLLRRGSRESGFTSPRGSSSSSSVSSSNRANSRGILVNRFLLIVVLVVLAGAAVYFQSEMSELNFEIHADDTKISELQEIIAAHEEVIKRFNNAVTNSDVLNRLQSLEVSLNTTENTLRHDLAKTEKEITVKLDDTLNQLAQTVTEAQTEIEDEVNKVKVDVEQYVRTTQDQFSMENSFMGEFRAQCCFEFVSSLSLYNLVICYY
jgi:N-methylhydantoinase B/oxoprolinase/acetone carboxylase alpha subunit